MPKCFPPIAQALKMLLAVVRHFGDFAEDQFDFHSYCVRKMTLRAYVAMLRSAGRAARQRLLRQGRPSPPWQSLAPKHTTPLTAQHLDLTPALHGLGPPFLTCSTLPLAIAAS